MNLDPKIWGPHYWFVLYSICMTYPETPNDVAKKKYYTFIQNLPLFLPHREISDEFSKILTNYPCTPYLDSRDSMLRWIHFIEARVDKSMGKPQMSFKESMDKYYTNYKTVQQQKSESVFFAKFHIWIYVVVVMVALCFFVYS
mgnify:CR=1 FL=1|jgi:hypothetical protein|tara:strand:+ start:1490 stop:1918 length:429 start_codon:yes stop_codon:yes gene_type:complete